MFPSNVIVNKSLELPFFVLSVFYALQERMAYFPNTLFFKNAHKGGGEIV